MFFRKDWQINFSEQSGELKEINFLCRFDNYFWVGESIP